MKLYKFLSDDGAACHGGTGKWPLPDGDKPGEWMPVIEDIEPCVHGYHLCREQDLLDWCGAEACFEAEYRGKKIVVDDKIVVSEARLIRKLNWDRKTRMMFGADCAERVLPIYEREFPNDSRVRDCIEATRRSARGEIGADELAALAAAAAAATATATAALATATATAALAAAAWATAAAAAATATATAALAAAAWAAEAAGAAEAKEREWQTARLVQYLGGAAT